MLVAAACSPPGRDLPDDQLLVSRIFAITRADAVLDPTIVARPETHRTEFNQRFGVTNGVIDYYLFRDQADLVRAELDGPFALSSMDPSS